MTAKWTVAIDQGTSSCRVFAVDEQGNVQARKSAAFLPTRTASGCSEYPAEPLLQVQLTLLNQLLDEVGPQQVQALAVCSQRSSVVLWDKQTGKPLAPVLTWEDGRAVKEAQQVPFSQEEIHTQTGLFKTPFFSAPKIAWCLTHCPQAARAAQEGTLLVAPIASYLIWHLTAGQVFATDATLAQRTLLWDIRNGQWSEALCRAFGVEIASLPRLQATVDDYGAYVYKGVAIPVRVCTADQQAAAYYHRLQPGRSAINYGTGAFVLHHTGTRLAVLPGMLSSVAVRFADKPQEFLLEGPIFAAGSALQWLQKQGFHFDIEQLDRLASQACNPIRFLPALGGLGAPYWDYRAACCIENLSPRTVLPDWIAGTLQAVAGLVADVVYYLRNNGQEVTGPVSVSGGLARSEYLLQQQADLLQLPLQLCNDAESTVLGAARLADPHVAVQPAGTLHTLTPACTAQQAQQQYRVWQEFVSRCRRKKI